MKIYNSKFYTKLILYGIFLIAFAFRFYGLNWDQGQHLHPDERFLTMVGSAMKMPGSFLQYLDPQTSPFNPTNIGYKFFVYGTFPLILNKLLAVKIGADNYNDFAIFGRLLSAFFDLLIVFLVYKTTALLEREYKYPRSLKFLAAFFYAIAVLPIQLSHFFTVDIFLNFFVFTSVYFILKYYYSSSFLDIILSAVFFACAVGSKVSAIYILPIHIFLLAIHSLKHNTHLSQNITPFIKKHTTKMLFIFPITLISFFLIIYLALRIAGPYYFIDSNIFHPKPNPIFLENIKELGSFGGKNTTYPPSIQWISKPAVLFSLYNIVFFGTGIIYFLFIVAGIYVLIKHHRSKSGLMILLVWSLGFFLYQSTQFVKVMRYFIFIYPYLAIFAAFGFYYLTRFMHKSIQIIILALLLSWPLSYLSIYINASTRVSATQWIYQNIPVSNTILSEHWDDALPLRMANINYNIQLLPVFDPDNTEKWNKMNALLQIGDYLILSSNRGWGSMPTVPEKYPLMTKFYKDLFAGKLQYKKIKEFTSYPSLIYMGIPFTVPDDWADESFTVYDHPKVMIFQRINTSL